MSVTCNNCDGELLIFNLKRTKFPFYMNENETLERYYRCKECRKEFTVLDGVKDEDGKVMK